MTGSADPNDDEALAAEYALRLLDVSARKAFEDRLRSEEGLRDLVHAWEARLVQLADDIDPVDPPGYIKSLVEDRISPKTSRAFEFRWRWVTGLGVAALIIFAFLAPILRGPDALKPSFQAELVSLDGAIVLTAGVIPATHEIVIDQVSVAPPEGRVFELWLIAEGSTVPLSLGVLEAEGTTRIRVPDEIAPSVRPGTLAISDEPTGGAPAGVPTGTILATGTFVDL